MLEGLVVRMNSKMMTHNVLVETLTPTMIAKPYPVGNISSLLV